MNTYLHKLRSCRIGLAFSGGSVRGLAHIGVIKALTEVGIKPYAIAGTSVGSIIGASMAAGLGWRELVEMATAVFWPSLLHGATLERFCEQYLPETFACLKLPFAAIATELPSKRVVNITTGKLASAISASCALRLIRRPVEREGQILKDGGIACVLPTQACRMLGAEIIIASDVWEISSVLHRMGCTPTSPLSGRFFPQHYRLAINNTHLLIQPSIPAVGYLPGKVAIERMIAIGEQAAYQTLSRLAEIDITPFCA